MNFYCTNFGNILWYEKLPNSEYMDSTESNFRFKVNLGGMIDLLANHLYSSPKVFVRELLQNGIDALQARLILQPQYEGEIHIELISSGENNATIIFEDNGIGLTDEEIHRFLAIIGESSKRNDLNELSHDFIGRFGIGLLSCFMVCNEIVVITRSVKSDQAFEWKGKADGTYSLRTLNKKIEPGTRIYLNAKKSALEYFHPTLLKELIKNYGDLLPFPVYFIENEKKTLINDHIPSWLLSNTEVVDKTVPMEYGHNVFGENFFDYIPLHSEVGGIEGVAYILPYKINPLTKLKHRVYLKRMLLTEESDKILPDWAFFVKCVINATSVRPTASREDFYEDEDLLKAREALGNCLRTYLIRLAEFDFATLKKFIAIHYLSIKSLAVDDDEFYKLFIKHLPFETSFGELPLGEIMQAHKTLYYTPLVDEFRQVSKVAAAQSICILNAGYVYDAELIEKLPRFFPTVHIERIDPLELTQTFQELSAEEKEQSHRFLEYAYKILDQFRCKPDIKRYKPHEMPALYNTNEESLFMRSLEQSQEQGNDLFSSVLENFSGNHFHISHYAQLCFNFDNPLIKKLLQLQDETFLKLAIEFIYLQSLLLGHHPLKNNELEILNSGLLSLLDWGINQQNI